MKRFKASPGNKVKWAKAYEEACAALAGEGLYTTDDKLGDLHANLAPRVAHAPEEGANPRIAPPPLSPLEQSILRALAAGPMRTSALIASVEHGTKAAVSHACGMLVTRGLLRAKHMPTEPWRLA